MCKKIKPRLKQQLVNQNSQTLFAQSDGNCESPHDRVLWNAASESGHCCQLGLRCLLGFRYSLLCHHKRHSCLLRGKDCRQTKADGFVSKEDCRRLYERFCEKKKQNPESSSSTNFFTPNLEVLTLKLKFCPGS